ncbi:MAG TPA: PilW family protein [Casimicrobiaceae bacterium]|nr:PilW family protein [Casimicrobiaceae bacterium]
MPARGHRFFELPHTRGAGFTLVEVMVAMTLALMVLGITVTLFSGSSRSRGDLERSSRLAENAQFALELVSDELKHTGFFADLNQAGVAWQVPDPCATAPGALGFSTAPFQLPVAIRGYTGNDVEPGCVRNRRAGTALFTIRRLAADTTPVAQAAAAMFLQVSKCNLDTPRLWRYASDGTDFTLRNIDCATVADIRRVLVRTYFVADCNACGRDTIPTLKRLDLDGNRIVETTLVEGIDNLQLEFGFDRNGDGNADVFLPTLSGIAGAPENDWSNVVAARVFVLARSADAEQGHLEAVRQYDFGEAGSSKGSRDAYKRTMLAALVRMPNIAGRRELP